MTAASSLDSTVGAALIGTLVAAWLLGVSTLQGFLYLTSNNKDHWFLVLVITAMLLAEVVHQFLISHSVYFYLITGYFNPVYLERLIWSILLEVLFNGIVAFLVQAFLSYRVWRLTTGPRIFLMVIIVSLIVAGLACAIAYTICSLRLSTWVQLSSLKGLSMAVNILGAAGDLLITIVLCYTLYRSKTGFKGSNNMIRRLMNFTMTTGLLTTACAIASLISILVWEKTFVYVAFYFCLGRLYSNSVLATLNARESIRDAGATGVDSSIPVFNSLRRDYSSETLTKIDTTVSKSHEGLPCGFPTCTA